MQTVLGIIISFLTYFPIAVTVGYLFYSKSEGSGAPFPFYGLVVPALIQIFIAGLIITKKSNKKNMGWGIVAGTIIMTLAMIFLTPSLGV